MPVGINFGTATSGTGFDVTATVSSIMALQRTPETAWATQTTALQAQDTVLSTLGTDVSSLSTALGSLSNFDGVFSQKQGASSNTNVVALSSVGISAQSGTHSFTVQRLATTAQQYSNAVASSATLSGTISLQAAGASSATTITIASGTSLSNVAAQINSSSAGVKATLLSDSNGQHLSLTATQSGAAGNLTVSSSAQDSNGNALNFTVAQSGVDAQYNLDGVSLTSGSNTVTSALQGVTFQLTGVSNTAATVQIAPDEDAVVSALQTFVTAYNTLTTALNGQQGKDSSGNSEPLYGSTVVSNVQSALSSAFAFVPSSSGQGVSLASLGLSLSLTGTLTLDAGVLATSLGNNFSDAAATFQTAGSFGQNLSTTLSNVGSGSTGTIGLALSSNNTQETELANNKTNLEARLAIYQADLTKQLNLANAILQAIPQQLNEVNQIFYSINGYKNG